MVLGNQLQLLSKVHWEVWSFKEFLVVVISLSLLGTRDSSYFGGVQSKGFATLRNVSKLPFFDKIGQAKSVGFQFYSAI